MRPDPSPRLPRVAFVAPYGLLAGSERYLELLLGALPRGVVQDVVLLQKGPFEARLDEAGYPAAVIPTSARLPSLLAAARQLRRRLREREPDLVHANGIKAAIVAVLATIGDKTPVVWLKHDLSYDGPVARLTALGCRVVVCPSRAAGATFGRLTSGRTRVIHYGLPAVEVDRPRARARLVELIGAPDDALVVAQVGRLHPVKGQLELVEVAARVRDAVPSVRFVLLGGDDPSVPHYGRSIRDRVDELGLGAIVSLPGHVRDADALVGGSDVLAMPSGPDERGMGLEVLPFAGLEAMASGVPAVAYSAGGVPELFGDCARLVPLRDRDALATALIELLVDRVLRDRLGECGQRRVAQLFTLPRMIDETLACYREALA